jgi:large-conductance mechanosensitive channel
MAKRDLMTLESFVTMASNFVYVAVAIVLRLKSATDVSKYMTSKFRSL